MASAYEAARADFELLVRAAEGYYLENKTQSQIADQLGISTSTVSRLLTRARDEGIVRITIVRPQGRHGALEQELRERFGLRDAIVASGATSGTNDDATRRALGAVAAPSIDALIRPGMIVGIGRSRALAALAEALQPIATLRPITIVQVMGEYDSRQSSSRSAEITRLVADAYAGNSYYLNAPALVDSPALAELLLGAIGVKQILPFYDRLDMVLAGVGPLHGSPLQHNGLIPPEQMAKLTAADVVGDICGHFFTSEGALMDAAYAGQVIGVRWEQLRRCPCVVGVAAGDNKAPALRALLTTDLLNVLVTDERTAQQIISI